MEENRAKRSAKNILTGLINKMIYMLVPFFLRTIILHILGAEYLGLNGLFTSILQILNLSELGLSQAIVYSLYEPLAKEDTKRINQILCFIRTAYRIIGSAIFGIGMLSLPFLDRLIKGEAPEGISIYILFVFYLLNTSSSYFMFSYRNCLLVASQRSDINNIINSLLKIVEMILQLIALISFKNIYLYVFTQVICTNLHNIISFCVTKKKYPLYYPSGKIESSELKTIKKQILGIMYDKVCCVSRSSFDSIFISSFLGLNIIAKYENYSYISNAMYSIVNIAASSLIASIGNSVVKETVRKNYEDMNELMFLFAWFYGWISITMFALYEPFMQIWMGQNMILPIDTVALFTIYFYILCMGLVRAIYVQATGIWWHERLRAVVETIANLLLNFMLIKWWGLNGVILGTCISLLLINFIYGSRYIFKYYFVKEKISDYFLQHATFIIVTVAVGIITWLLCECINENPIKNLIYRLVVCFLVPNFVTFIIVRQSRYYRYFLDIRKRLGGIFK